MATLHMQLDFPVLKGPLEPSNSTLASHQLRPIVGLHWVHFRPLCLRRSRKFESRLVPAEETDKVRVWASNPRRNAYPRLNIGTELVGEGTSAMTGEGHQE